MALSTGNKPDYAIYIASNVYFSSLKKAEHKSRSAGPIIYDDLKVKIKVCGNIYSSAYFEDWMNDHAHSHDETALTLTLELPTRPCATVWNINKCECYISFQES